MNKLNNPVINHRANQSATGSPNLTGKSGSNEAANETESLKNRP